MPSGRRRKAVDEDLAGKHFAMPVLLENLDDYPGDDSALIELEKLGSKPLSMFVKTEDGRISIGDRIVAVYTATLTGKPDIVVTVSLAWLRASLGRNCPVCWKCRMTKGPFRLHRHRGL